MAQWWISLTLLEQVLCCVALPATLLLLIQTVLLLAGLGEGGEEDPGGADLDGDGVPDLDLDGDGIPDLDLDGDGIPDLDLTADLELEPPGEEALEGLNLFTLRGVVALLSVFGWSGLFFLQLELSPLLAVALAAALGLGAMYAVAWILRKFLRLQESGTLDYRNALGLTGQVYLTIPPLRQGAGKVELLVQGQLRELDAVTDFGEAILTGDYAVVVGVTRGGAMVVSPAPGGEEP